MSLFLPPEHLTDLQKSGLTPNTIERLKYSSVVPSSLNSLGGKYRDVTSAYKLPYFTLAGEINGFERLKLFPPIKDKDGHTIKYYQKAGTAPHLYWPPLLDWQAIACDPEQPVWKTEGEKKSAAFCQRGSPCIGVGGVWNWRVKLESGERLVCPELDQIVWKGRQVEIIPDSDGWRPEKLSNVLAGFYALGMELIQRGARVQFIKLPEAYGVKVGLDDWLVNEGTQWEHAFAHLERIGLDDARLRKLAAWWQRWSKKPEQGQAEEKQKRPEIDFGIKDLEVLTSLCWDALRQANDPPRFFRFAGVPSRLEQEDNGHAIIKELTPYRMRYELARVAQWVRTEYTEDGGEKTIPGTPPMAAMHDLLATPNPPLPVLIRIVDVPVFAQDGSLLATPGYHPTSQLYFNPQGMQFPKISVDPSEEDLTRAKSLFLEDLLGDFPFVSDADRAHAVGLALLPFARELIPGPTPNHLNEAPTAGSGKGLLVDAALTPAIGHHVSVMAEARDDEEWRKRLTTCFREGRPVIFLDNIVRPMDSGVLASALTALTWDDRLLGKSETLKNLPVRCVWVTTANNPILSTEIARRCVRIRIDPRVDRPWTRDGFRHLDLRSWAKEHRAELVWAALTLIQAWLAAGRPRSPKLKPLGSYEGWSAVIGGILGYAGILGFLENLNDLYETADREGAAWRVFVQGWWEQFQNRAVGTADLFPLAEEIEGIYLGQGKDDRAQRTVLGKQLAKHRDRVIGEYRIEAAGEKKRASQWQLAYIGQGKPPEMEKKVEF